MTALQGLYRPKTVEEATALLAQDGEAKPLAGGATLVAMLNARVIEPAALVSLADIEELRGISVLDDGQLRIGAFTRHRDTAACTLARGSGGVVPHAASQIANATVRNMGTIGGSISFADPGLDYPPALVAANAVIEMASTEGRRLLPAADFFVDWYLTALEPGEIVTAVLLPPADHGAGVYVKHARVAGDYATASVAACLNEGGGVRVAVGACGPTPLWDPAADALLTSDRGDAAIARAGQLLVERADPLDDVRGSADYRRQLIPRLLLRGRARGRSCLPERLMTATLLTPPKTLVSLQVNGERAEVDAALHDTLLTVLRDRMHLTAAKRGCNQGVCGACTISVDDVPMRACLSLAHNCESAEIATLEGLQDCPQLKALQSAFARNGAFQCGFCTPGMLVSARALLRRDPAPDEAAIRAALSGNLCRCTGYVKIVAAVQAASETLRADGAAS